MAELRQCVAGLVYLSRTFRPGRLAVDAKCERMYNESLTLAAEFPGQKVMGGFIEIAVVVVTSLTANSGYLHAGRPGVCLLPCTGKDG